MEQKVEEISQELTKEDVWNVIEYVDGLYRGIKNNGIDINGNTYIYNPQSEQFNLKNVTNFFNFLFQNTTSFL